MSVLPADIAVDETKGKILPKPTKDGFYQILSWNIKNITLKRDVGNSKAGTQMSFVALTLRDLSNVQYGIGFSLIKNPGIASTMGKLIIAYGRDLNNWNNKWLYLTIGSIGGHSAITASPQDVSFSLPVSNAPPAPQPAPVGGTFPQPPAQFPQPQPAPIISVPFVPPTPPAQPPAPVQASCRACGKLGPVDARQLCEVHSKRYAEVSSMFPTMSDDDKFKLVTAMK